MDGKYFQTFVEQGQKVQAGDILVIADLAGIQAAGYTTISPIVVTNTSAFSAVHTTQTEIHIRNE